MTVYPTFWRQHHLRERYFFTCNCKRCRSPDYNRRVPCSYCYPRTKGCLKYKLEDYYDKKTKKLNEGFLIWDPSIEKWCCDGCKNESAANGIPPFLEKQIIIEVQRMMKVWSQFPMTNLNSLQELCIGTLGPEHWATKWSEKVICEKIRSLENKNKRYLNYMKGIIKWLDNVPLRDAG
eukprot:UN23719